MAKKISVWERLKNLFARPKPPVSAPPPAAPPENASPAPQSASINAPAAPQENPPVQSEIPSALRPVKQPRLFQPELLPPNPLRPWGPRRPVGSPTDPVVDPAPATPTTPAPRGLAIDLVLGIDFGTSCTKVVIGDGRHGKAFPIPFGSPATDLASWLHPTRLGDETNLKMRLMETPDDPAVRDLVACYLATVITSARSWFKENSPGNYSRHNCSWSLNLGFPEKKVRSNSSLALAYRRCAEIALQLVALTGTPTPQMAARFRTGEQEIAPAIPPNRIHLYPEIAAQLAGYIKSSYRQRGNLLLIDVGAGTLDVSTLIIHDNQEEDIVSFHVCDVKPLGVLRLYQARAGALNREAGCCATLPVDAFQDGCTAIPDSTGEMLNSSFPLPTPALKKAFEKATEQFAAEVLGSIHPCLTQFRVLQRDAHLNTGFDPRPGHLRFFLTGGGSRADFYREHLVQGPLEQQLWQFTRWDPDPAQRAHLEQGLRLESMSTPRNLVGFPESLSEHFDRLSVAYGLAQGPENLPDITGGGDPVPA